MRPDSIIFLNERDLDDPNFHIVIYGRQDMKSPHHDVLFEANFRIKSDPEILGHLEIDSLGTAYLSPESGWDLEFLTEIQGCLTRANIGFHINDVEEE